jgi:methyl halide transferase
VTGLGEGGAGEDWEGRYRAGRTGWERDGLHPAFLAWRAGALRPCRILVPGAGRSLEPQALVEAGFDVTVVDAAHSAVAVQSDRIGAGRVVQADLLTWDPPCPFDAIYDQTCLCALAPGSRTAYEQQLHGWLRPDGVLFALLMQTGREGGPPYDCGLEAMRALFAPARWAWPDALPAPVPHPSGLSEQPVALRRRGFA